jgi:hypothetical protein
LSIGKNDFAEVALQVDGKAVALSHQLVQVEVLHPSAAPGGEAVDELAGGAGNCRNLDGDRR